MVGLAGLAFAASWFYLTRELFLIALKLGPAARAGEPTAILLIGLALPLALFLAQGLFYVPGRRSRPPVFIHPADPILPLCFLPLPQRVVLTTGPALELACTERDREKLLVSAQSRYRLSLSARLALLLQSRTPLDRLMNLPVERAWPLIAPLARLFYLFFSPSRQFLRCWGYLFFRLWRAWDDPGPLDQLTAYKQALAYDLVDRAGEGAAPEDLQRVWNDLAHIYDHPGYGYELGEAAPSIPGPVMDSNENRDRPWLAPRYRGVYLDLEVTRAAGSLDELYDNGPEEAPGHFYPPELGLEVELTARLRAERHRLALALSQGRAGGLIWLDGRLRSAWELENSIWDLDERLWQEKKRVAAHHRRCRSSHLAAAKRRGEGWLELLRAALARLFIAERARPDWRDEALAILLAAEEAVNQETNAKLEIPWPEFETVPAWGGLPPAPPEPPPRVYSAAAQLNTGFERGLLALLILGLLLWQGGLAGRSYLTIYNGLARDLVVTLDGRRLPLAPWGRVTLSLPPSHECRIRTTSSNGQLVEALEQRISPLPGREIYNIGGAAPLMEWGTPDKTKFDGPGEFFLGRPRWLRTEADVLFRNPSRAELEEGVLVLSAYGDDSPGAILEAFADEQNKDELIRLHARWDGPDSAWFWHWQILMTGHTDWISILLDRLNHEPDFLEEALHRFDRNDTLGSPSMDLQPDRQVP